LTVNSTSTQVFLGASEVFTASASLSNGAQSPVTNGAWTSDAPNVAQVDGPSGRVTGATSGNANISVDYQGKRGTKAIRIIPNYQGGWSGTYTVNSCVDTLQFQSTGFCATVFPGGSVLPFALGFAQNINGALAGQTAIGSIISNTSTSQIQNDGSTVFPALAPLGSTTTFSETWTMTIVQAGHLAGTLHVVVTDTTISGSGTMDAKLNDATLQTLARTLGLRPAASAVGSFTVRRLADAIRSPWQ
jgi:hypothetical protein